MFRVIETFSGIGAQAKALERIGIDYEIVNTCDWDINAILAYYRIHEDDSNECNYRHVSDEDIDAFLRGKTLSMDGKKPIHEKTYNRFTSKFKRKLYVAIQETKNLVSITDVHGTDIPEDIDLFTYSFPCQDLSLCGCWHGNKSGISREAHNRSGMLWEVERILKEMHAEHRKLPRFLVMENVTNILSSTNIDDFNDWQNTLANLGYYNKIYRLNAKNFGVPQKRERAYMISIRFDGDLFLLNDIMNYYDTHNLADSETARKYRARCFQLKDVLKLDYRRKVYRKEAEFSQPNDTPSREKILRENDMLYDGKRIHEMYVNTVTTKQDRNPNSGLITYYNGAKGKAKWRYLTPRECFLLMGFDEKDVDKVLLDMDTEYIPDKKLLTYEKMIKMAGNSICVDVLEAIFNQIVEISQYVLERG